MRPTASPFLFARNLAKFVRVAGAVGLACIIAGCSTPGGQPVSNTTILQPDQEDGLGGSFIDSQDIRTVAGNMTGALLSTPEIGGSDEIVRIAIAPIRNSTRYMFDKDIFMKRLRIELNRNAGGRVRFLSQGMGQEVRRTIIRESEDDLWEDIIDDAAEALVSSSVVEGMSEPGLLAVIPVRNTNLAGVNADSFTSMLRAKVAEKAGGKIMFLAREKSGKVIEEILDEQDAKNQGLVAMRKARELHGVDYFLGGEFVGKSITGDSGNVTKYLLVKLIDADTGAIPFEKMVKVQSEIKSGVGRADYFLTGELSGLSKAVQGDRSDYVIMSFQLVDPQTNEMLWEDAYETKKKSSVSVIYK